MIKYEIKTHIEGSPNQYWSLRVFKEGKEFPEVHTSKSRAYIEKIKEEYIKGIRVGSGCLFGVSK